MAPPVPPAGRRVEGAFFPGGGGRRPSIPHWNHVSVARSHGRGKTEACVGGWSAGAIGVGIGRCGRAPARGPVRGELSAVGEHVDVGGGDGHREGEQQEGRQARQSGGHGGGGGCSHNLTPHDLLLIVKACLKWHEGGV